MKLVKFQDMLMVDYRLPLEKAVEEAIKYRGLPEPGWLLTECQEKRIAVPQAGPEEKTVRYVSIYALTEFLPAAMEMDCHHVNRCLNHLKFSPVTLRELLALANKKPQLVGAEYKDWLALGTVFSSHYLPILQDNHRGSRVVMPRDFRENHDPHYEIILLFEQGT